MTETLWSPTRRRGRPPASDSALTRERILRSAQQVFAQSGYENTTYQAIAARIGLTRPAINNYFSSKSELHAAVVGRVGNAVLDAIRIASEESTPAEQLLTFVRLVIRDSDPSLAGFLVQSAREAGRPHPEALALAEGFVRAAVGAAARRGEVTGDPDGLAEVLIALIWGTAFQLGRYGGARADRMLQRLRPVVEQGLIA